MSDQPFLICTLGGTCTAGREPPPTKLEARTEADGPVMQEEEWMNLRESRPLADAGVPCSEIVRLACGDPRTAKNYLRSRRLPRYRPRPGPPG